MSTEPHILYSQLPSIDALLHQEELQPLLAECGSLRITALLRTLQDEARAYIRTHQQLPAWHSDWVAIVQQKLLLENSTGLIPVLNLTGTVLHTNLGRALLADSAITAVSNSMRQPVTLEYNLHQAERGKRDHTVANLLCELTGAEDACIVNNNAAAVLLILATIARDKQVIISRGELVEIGGSFRVPDMMRQAGCQLIEVGTTNRTHLKDYQAAINEQTALLMKVHTSNYQIQGFTAAVPETELVHLAQHHQLPVVADLGSGSLIDMQSYGLPAETTPQSLIAAGVDLVCFSGDKLLGGPQAGLIVGKKQWIEQLQSHPLKRVLRVDKMTLSALEATLKLYRQPELLAEQLPTLRLLTRQPGAILAVAEQLLPTLQQNYGEQFAVAIEPCYSQIGSGSLPVDLLPSYAITFSPKDGQGSTLNQLVTNLRNLSSPVIGRLSAGKLWLDLRCLEQAQQLLDLLPA